MRGEFTVDTLTKTAAANGKGTVTLAKANGSLKAASAGSGMSQAAADIKAQYEAKLKAAYDAARATPQAQLAEPQGWWDLVAIGPIQQILNPPYLPHDVIRAGQPAYVITIMVLNPFGPSVPSACEILSNFALPYEITYQTGNVTTWQPGPASLNVEHNLTLVPGQCFYVDVLEFTGEGLDEVMYEMNVSARIFGCGENYAPDFAGFAREVIDIDPDIFRPAPGLVNGPIRFLVYGEHNPSE
jgi:hypothetical protein